MANDGEMEITLTIPTECEEIITTIPTTTPTEERVVKEVGAIGDPTNSGCPTGE